MNNLSLKTTFVILALNIIAASIETVPPQGSALNDKELLNFAKKTQEPQKASSPPISSPIGNNRGGALDPGQWLILLIAIILTGIASIFEPLKIRCKKAE
jgi:hypothetical protein